MVVIRVLQTLVVIRVLQAVVVIHVLQAVVVIRVLQTVVVIRVLQTVVVIRVLLAVVVIRVLQAAVVIRVLQAVAVIRVLQAVVVIRLLQAAVVIRVLQALTMKPRCRRCRGFLFTLSAAGVIVGIALLSWSSRTSFYTLYRGVDNSSVLTSTVQHQHQPKAHVSVITERGALPNPRGDDVGETLKSVKGTLSSHDDDDGLREYQSSVDEAKRLRELLLNSHEASPPKLTAENCTALTLGESGRHRSTYRQRTTDTNVATSRPPRSMRELLALTENCTRYVLGTGFRFAQVSEEELSFPLAFSIMAYKDLEQVSDVQV